MNEQMLNSVISRSLAWAFKIPDTRGTSGILPFDGFGMTTDGRPVYWEAKNLKKVQAFNFNNLSDHQIDNLCSLKRLNPEAKTLLLIGVDFGFADKRVFIFDDPFYIQKRKQNAESITQKEFKTLRNYVKIKKQRIEESTLLEASSL